MAKEVVQEPIEELEDDDIIIRKKKAPEQKTGVTAEAILKNAAAALETLRAKGPLVQCMTSDVAAGFSLRAVQAAGGEAATIGDMGEASQFTSVIDSLLVNVSAVTKTQADAMRAAVSHANMSGKPWVMDPERVGVLPLRTFTAKELMRRFPAVIRGNAEEITFLVSNVVPKRGDAIDSAAVIESAKRLAGVTRAAVLVTGATDYIAVEGAPVVAIENGCDVMARVAGLGSVQGALSAAFIGALGSKARWEAALAVSLVTSIAGERAAAAAKGPGSFVPAFLDALYTIKPEDVIKNGKVKILSE